MTWKKVTAWTSGSILGIIVVAIALLHVPGILRPVLLGALRAGLTDKMEVSVSASRISGSPLSGLHISDLHLATPGDSTWMHVERVDVSYGLWPLLRGRVDVPRFEMEGTSFSVARRMDGDFVLPVWESNPDSELPGVRVDRIRLSGLAGNITEARTDTLWVLRQAGLLVSDLALGPAAQDSTFSVRVDTLHAAFDYAAPMGAGSGDASPNDSLDARGGRLAASGAHDVASTLRLSFEAPHSRLELSADGAADAASPTGLRMLEASATGHIGLADLEPFVAGLRSGTQVQVDLAARADTARASLNSLFTTSAGGSVAVQFTAEPEGSGASGSGASGSSSADDSRTSFSLQADVSELSPAALLTTFPEGETGLGATASAEGWFHRGPKFTYMATAALDLRQSTVAGWTLDSGRADVLASQDTTSWTARISALGAELATQGALYPDTQSTPNPTAPDRAGPGHIVADLTLTNLTQQVLGGSALPFTVTLGAKVRGRTDSLALSLRLADSTVGDCPVTLTRGRGRWQPGQSRLALDISACGDPLLASVLRERSQEAASMDMASAWALDADLFPAPLDRVLLLANSTHASGHLSARYGEALSATLRLVDVAAGGARIDSVDARATGTLRDITLNAQLFQFTGAPSRPTPSLHEAATIRARWTAASTRKPAEIGLTEFVADSLDLGRIVDISPHTALLHARGTGRISLASNADSFSGAIGTAPTGRFALDLAGSTMNGLHLASAEVNLSMTADSTEARIRAAWDVPPANKQDDKSSQEASLEGRAVQRKGGVTDALVSFSHINIRQLLPDSSHASNLTGSLTVRGDTSGTDDVRGGVPGAWTADVRLDSTSTLNGVALGGGSGQFRMDSDRMAGRLDLGNATGAGNTTGVTGPGYAASASFGYAGAQLYADATLSSVPVARLAGQDTDSRLSGRMETNLYFEDGKWTRIAVWADSLDGFWGEVELTEGGTEFELTPGSLRIDSLRLSGPELLVSGLGFLEPGASNLRLDLELPPALMRIPPLNELGMQIANAKADIRITGPASARRAAGDLEIRGLRNDQVFFNKLAGRLLAEWNGEGEEREDGNVDNEGDTVGRSAAGGQRFLPSVAELTLTSDVIQVVTAQLSGGHSRIAWDGEAITADTKITITPTRTISFTAAYQPANDPPVLFLDEASIRLDDTNWELVSPARLTLGDHPMLSGFVMTSQERRLSAVSTRRDGEAARHQLALVNIPLGAGADLFGYAGLDGELSGQISMSDGILQGTLGGTVSAYGQEVGPFTARIGMKNDVLTLRSELSHGTGGSLTAEGTLPLDGAGSSDAGSSNAGSSGAGSSGAAPQKDVRFAVEAREYPIGWMRVFIDPLLIDDLRGTISGNVDISGQTSSPTWQGAMTLKNGRVGLPVLGKRRGLRYSDINADLAFRADSLIVERVRATSGGGEVTGSGHMILTNLQLGTLAVDFEADRFLAVDSREYRTVISGEGRLEGTTLRPLFGGDIRVVSADFFLTDNTTSDAFEPVTLTDEDLLTLQERFGVRIAADDTTAFDFYRVLAIDDLTIRLQSDTWFRSESNPEMDIQLEGRLDVTKNRNEDPTVFGTININPARSQIRQFGRRFNLDKGTFTFNGPIDTPTMDMEASYEVPSRSSGGQEVTIRLLVSGTPEDLTVDFESDPAMELADIVSYIATGRPASESFQIVGSQNDSYLQSAAGLAMGPLTNLMENMAASNLGLDVIEISQSGTQGMTLTAGKYVSPKLYVSISQPFTLSEGGERSPASAEQDTQVAMEYEIVRNLLISLLSRGTILRVNLRWEYAF